MHSSFSFSDHRPSYPHSHSDPLHIHVKVVLAYPLLSTTKKQSLKKAMADQIEKLASLAQDQLDKEAASDPAIRKIMKIVENFLKTHRVMC